MNYIELQPKTKISFVEKVIKVIAILMLISVICIPIFGHAQTATPANSSQKAIPTGTVIFHNFTGDPNQDYSPSAEMEKAQISQYERTNQVKVITTESYQLLLDKKGQEWIDARPMPYQVVENLSDVTAPQSINPTNK